MPLDNQLSDLPTSESKKSQEPTLIELFADSALYELHQSVYGLAQAAGLESHIGQREEPVEQSGRIDRLAQILGRGVGSFLPTAAVAVGTRFGLGRVLEHAGSAESLLLKRSVIGLSIAESAATGAITGSLLKPSGEAAAGQWQSFAADRALGGLSGALSFSAMTLASHGWNRFAGSEPMAKIGLGGFLKSSIVAGSAAGAAGGFVSAETSSLLTEGKFNTDSASIGSSMYQMAVVGGLFGATSSGLALLGRARNSVKLEHSVTGSSALQSGDVANGYPGANVAGAHTSPSFERLSDPEQPAALPESTKGIETWSGAARFDILEHWRLQFGEEFHTLNALQRFGASNPGLDLGMLADFIDKDTASRIPLVKSVVSSDGASLQTLASDRLEALEKLNSLLAENSKDVNRLLKLEFVDGFKLPQLVRFIEEQPDSRLALVKSQLVEGASARDFDAKRLAALESIPKLFGENSAVMTALLSSEKRYKWAGLAQLCEFVNESPESRKPLIEKLATNKDYYLPGARLLALEKLSALYGDDSPVYKSMERRSGAVNLVPPNVLSMRTIEFGELAKYIEEKPELRRALVQSVVLGDEWEVLPTRSALENVERVLNSFTDLVEPKKNNLALVAQFLEDASVEKSWSDCAKLEQQLCVFKLSKYLGREFRYPISQYSTKPLINMENTDALSRFIERSPEAHTEIVRRLLASGADSMPHDMNDRYLTGVERLFQQFGSEHDLFERMVNLYQNSAELISKFVDQDPSRNKALVRKSLEESGDEFYNLEPSRLQGLAALTKEFGENSPTLQALLQLERNGASLADVAQFIAGAPENKALIEELAVSDPVGSLFRLGQLGSRQQLSELFGRDAHLLEKLSAYVSDGLDLSELTKFLKGGSLEQSVEPPDRIGERKELVEELLNSGAPVKLLDGPRLQALFELNDRFGKSSPTMNRILTAEAAGDFNLSALAPFAQTRLGRVFVERYADNQGPLLEPRHWLDAARLERGLQPDEKQAERIADLVLQGLDMRSLMLYIRDGGALQKAHPEKQAQFEQLRRELVNQQIAAGATPRQFTPNRLETLASLSQQFAKFDGIFPRLLELEKEGFILKALDQFVAHDDSRQSLVARRVAAGTTSAQLEPHNLLGLQQIEQLFKNDAPALERLRSMEGDQPSFFADLNAFVTDHEDQQVARQQILKLLNDYSPARRFTVNRLFEPEIGQMFEGDAEQARLRLAELCDEGFNARNLYLYLKGSPQHVSTVEGLLSSGASREQLTTGALSGYWFVHKALESEPQLIKRVYELHARGLDIQQLGGFLSQEPGSGHILQRMLELGYDEKRLTVAGLHDFAALRSLTAYLGAESKALPYLEELHADGLSGARLAEYVREHPAPRASIVEELADRKAERGRFNDQMRLIAFPEPIASRLADSARTGGMSVAELVGHLRDWRFGREFREKVIRHVESGAPTGRQDLSAIVEEVKNSAASDSLEPSARGDGYRQASELTVSLAKMLTEAADRIAQTVPAKRPVVLLGRDTWPLLPMLRQRGVESQYFLWSRLNEGVSTRQRWKKEVPPGAVAIDSGFNGSIFKMIRSGQNGDSTASGLLLYANYDSPYQQLLTGHQNNNMVVELEKLIKYTNRSKAYTEKGGAIVAADGQDGDSDVVRKHPSRPGASRWAAEGLMRDIFRESGLGEWETWRYSQFVGLTPQERLALNTPAEVAAHYERVRQLRESPGTYAPVMVPEPERPKQYSDYH